MDFELRVLHEYVLARVSTVPGSPPRRGGRFPRSGRTHKSYVRVPRAARSAYDYYSARKTLFTRGLFFSSEIADDEINRVRRTSIAATEGTNAHLVLTPIDKYASSGTAVGERGADN